MTALPLSCCVPSFNQVHCLVSKGRWGRSTFQEWVTLCQRKVLHRSEWEALSEILHLMERPRGPVQLRGLGFVQTGKGLAGKPHYLFFSRQNQVSCFLTSANISKKFRLFMSKAIKFHFEMCYWAQFKRSGGISIFKTNTLTLLQFFKLEPMESQRVIIQSF